LKPLLDEMYSAQPALPRRFGRLVSTCAPSLSSDWRGALTRSCGGDRGRARCSPRNVADFARISAEHVSTGEHHPGVLIALSSRFSRRTAGIEPPVRAVRDIADQQLTDRLVYLQAPSKT
jgi:hypothetical protein